MPVVDAHRHHAPRVVRFGDGELAVAVAVYTPTGRDGFIPAGASFRRVRWPRQMHLKVEEAKG